MKILTLVENTTVNSGCTAEHGLCVYVETEKHRILMDSGQTDALITNVSVLGVDLTSVDTVILSHGHYDHSGGIMPFYEINRNARIIMQRSAADPRYHGERYIGIDSRIKELPVTLLIEGDLKIDDELFIFSGIKGRRLYPQGNYDLKCIVDNKEVCDDFSHEQCLVINSSGKSILLSGCAHNGILNILDRYRELYGKEPDYVISGFHMRKKEGAYTAEEEEVIIKTANELSKMNTVFFTGHCTGEPAFDIMKKIMNDKLRALHTGEFILSE
jgi:7,8-dihydropterin-6-yl-methyl-4-(beta-D-ribofuranosyl)aminobenzene 5'-phosphate synthase